MLTVNIKKTKEYSPHEMVKFPAKTQERLFGIINKFKSGTSEKKSKQPFGAHERTSDFAPTQTLIITFPKKKSHSAKKRDLLVFSTFTRNKLVEPTYS